MEQVDVVLIYPQRAPVKGRHWIMPSLGLSYLNSALRSAGYSCRHLDHTFLERREVLAEIERLKPRVIGIYCMVTMQDEAFSLARDLKGKALLVVGGPYPSGEPEPFLDAFDLAGVGEQGQDLGRHRQCLIGHRQFPCGSDDLIHKHDSPSQFHCHNRYCWLGLWRNHARLNRERCEIRHWNFASELYPHLFVCHIL